MPFDLWLTFAAATIAILMIPGPTILLVLSYALTQGRRVAVATAAGVALGDLVAMTASLIGLGALVAASAAAFTVLKWAGAAYLVYLGIKMLRSAPKSGASLMETDANASARSVFGATIVTAQSKYYRFLYRICPASTTRSPAMRRVPWRQLVLWLPMPHLRPTCRPDADADTQTGHASPDPGGRLTFIVMGATATIRRSPA